MQSDPASALLTIAEVAATFAGFTALVTLFARRRVAAHAVHDLLRLRLVIGASVVTVISALVPVALFGYGLGDDLGWRIAAALFLALTYFSFASFITSYKPVRGSFPPDRLAVTVAACLEVPIQLGLWLVVLGFFPERHYGLYVSALIGTIAQAAFVFLRLVESAFSTIVRQEAAPD